MAVTPSTMLPLGTPLPRFSLPNVLDDREVSSGAYDGQPLLVMFVCNHCPYVKHIWDGMTALANEYLDRGVGVVAINSNDVEAYPDDAPGPMKQRASASGWKFPYLLDETQEVAGAFKAACTPDFYVFDADGKLVYRGQFDGARPGNNQPVTGADLRAALDAVLEGRPAPEEQKPSMGCNIKWTGGAPPY